MDAKLLESALRRVYPAGTVYEMAEGALDDKERDGRIRSVLQYCAAECRLNWGVDVFTTPAYTIWLTQKEHPSFHEWAGMKVPEQIASVVKRGEPYPVLWLRISRVADYYYHYFNHWTPRGGTGYMDADCIRPANDTWAAHLTVIERQLQKFGFEFMTQELCCQKTPLVLQHDYDSIPEDDPRLDDVNFEPPLAPTTLHECLFSD